MGKNIQLENSGPLLTLEQISLFEKEIDRQLPEDYKQFLLIHNGGCCEPDLGLPRAGELEEIPSFYSLLPEDSGVRSALHDLRTLNPAVANDYLPIASTLSQSQICLAYQGTIYGAVFITEYECNRRGIPIDVKMVRVADSFAEFLDSLVEIPNPYCRIENLGKQGTVDDLRQYLAEDNSINAVSKNGDTILCEAIKFNNLTMIQACIEHGASLSGSVKLAVGNLHIEAIKMLVKAGADVNEVDEFGVTPMFYLCGWELPGEEGERRRELLNLLVKLGAVEVKNGYRGE